VAQKQPPHNVISIISFALGVVLEGRILSGVQKMISLTNQLFNMIKHFKNDEKLWLYLQRQAQSGALAQEAEGARWGFTYYAHHMLRDFLEISREKNFADIVQQSCDLHQNIIVIHQGAQGDPYCCLVTPGLDTARLKRDWSKAYVDTHGLIVIRE
jgi:hypothetical protein